MGYDHPLNDGKEHFPGFGADAIKVLIEREIAAIGTDTASLDCGDNDFKFPVHTVFLRSDRY